MRILPIVPMVLVLSGCISLGGRTGPGEIPDDAVAAMYTDIAPEVLASCLARTIGGEARPNAGRILVGSPVEASTTYDVGANASGGDYPTEVIVRGRQNAAEEQRLGTCFVTGAPPA